MKENEAVSTLLDKNVNSSSSVYDVKFKGDFHKVKVPKYKVK